MRHIVIVGAGFAGMRLARKLSKQKNVKVSLINPSTQFRYTPALYRAASGLNGGTAWLPLEWMLLDAANVTFVLGSVAGIDNSKKTIELHDSRIIEFDDIVFALGSVTTYFSITGLDEYSYGVKSADEIHELKEHIHANLLHPDKASKDYVIIGAGPTGVEFSAVLGAHIKRISKRHHVSSAHLKIHLVEAGPRILPQLSNRASCKALKQLQNNNVIVHTSTQVKAETANTLKMSLGTMQTDNVIWTAGTMNNPFFAGHPDIFELDKRGKVVVDKHLQVSHNVYVCGDNAATPFSGLALTAIKHADFIADDIKRRMKNKKRKVQCDHHPMQVVPIGEKHAVFQYRAITLSGRLISIIRKVADIIGYTDIMGILRAFTIWRNSDSAKVACDICGR